MKQTLYLSVQETLHLHENLIDRFGGPSGVRDLGLLESSLSRPQSGYYKSLSTQAAALFQSLCLNHCFVDGNKRVAFAATAIFLRLNGYQLRVSAKEGEKFITVNIIKEKTSLEDITQWLESKMLKK